MGRRPKPPDQQLAERLSVRLLPAEVEPLRRIAEASERTISVEIRRAVRMYVAAHEKDQAPGP